MCFVERQGYRKVECHRLEDIHHKNKGMWLSTFNIPLPIFYDCLYNDNQ